MFAGLMVSTAEASRGASKPGLSQDESNYLAKVDQRVPRQLGRRRGEVNGGARGSRLRHFSYSYGRSTSSPSACSQVQGSMLPFCRPQVVLPLHRRRHCSSPPSGSRLPPSGPGIPNLYVGARCGSRHGSVRAPRVSRCCGSGADRCSRRLRRAWFDPLTACWYGSAVRHRASCPTACAASRCCSPRQGGLMGWLRWVIEGVVRFGGPIERASRGGDQRDPG